jgi:rRNA maturation endonuclease Nob1
VTLDREGKERCQDPKDEARDEINEEVTKTKETSEVNEEILKLLQEELEVDSNIAPDDPAEDSNLMFDHLLVIIKMAQFL